jgi:hypothetical protein
MVKSPKNSHPEISDSAADKRSFKHRPAEMSAFGPENNSARQMAHSGTGLKLPDKLLCFLR